MIYDVDRIEWLEQQTKLSSSGISFDWFASAGFRFMRKNLIGGNKPTLRDAIDSIIMGDLTRKEQTKKLLEEFTQLTTMFKASMPLVVIPEKDNYTVPVLCVDCKYNSFSESFKTHHCYHPTNISVVTGEQGSKPCNDMRGASGLCGKEGRWFVAKELPVPPMPEGPVWKPQEYNKG